MRNRILLFSFLIVVLPLTVIFLLTSRIIEDEMGQQIDGQVRAGRLHLDEILGARLEKYGRDGADFAAGEKLRFSVTYELTDAVDEAVEAFKRGGGFDFVRILSSSGETLSETGDLPGIAFDAARFAPGGPAFESVGDLVLLVSFQSIADEKGEGLGGYLVFGQRIDEAFAAALKSNVGTDVLLFREGRTFAGTLGHDDLGHPPVGEGERRTDRIGDEEYVLAGVALPVAPDGGPPLAVCVAVSRRNIAEAEARNRTVMFATTLVCLALALGISLAFLQRAILGPIQQLTRGVEGIGKGDLEERVEVHTAGEIQVLADAFNRMTVELKENRDEIERWNRELEAKVEERTRDLKSAQAQLIQSEKMASLGQMVAGIAHEINNPTNFIAGGAENLRTRIGEFRDFLFELMGEEEKDSEIGKEILAQIEGLEKMIATIRSGSDRVKKIVLSLRTFSRLDEAEVKEVDLHEGIESTLEIVQFKIKSRVEVVRDFGDLPPVECNASQINQVLLNLLVNAAQAIEEEGRITIVTRVEGDDVTIAISDTGSGIAEEELARIFDPFFTTKEVGEGTGLGLSISYGILRDHGGEISVESTVGRGTTFTLRLPVRRAERSETRCEAS